jgi:uncharacterized membrane protein
MDGGDRLTQVFAGLLLCGVAYVTVRAMLADRRGDDPRQAARAALSILAPALFVGGVLLFIVVVFLAVVTVVVILSLLGYMTGEDRYDSAANALLLGTAVALVVTVGAVIRWGLGRIRRSRAPGG